MHKILLFAAYILLIESVNAQSTSTQMGARAAGMGYASVTVADEWSMFNNIGGLAKVIQPTAGFAYEVKPALIGANRTAAFIAAPTKVGALGVGIFKFGDDVYNEHLVSFGLGNTIGNTSLGLKANYIQYRAESFGMTNAISFDFGGLTQITPQISIGAYITNITQAKLATANGVKLPTKLVAGAGFKPNDKTFITTEVEKDLDYQATWRSGLEYTAYKKVFFRTGFSANPNAAFFGLGVRKSKIKFDYAIILNKLVGAAHQASAVYILSSSTKK